MNIIFRNYVIISFPQTVARNCCTLRLSSSCVFNDRCLPYYDRCTKTERKLLTIKKRDYCMDLNGRTKLGNGRTNSVVLGQSVQTLLHIYFGHCYFNMLIICILLEKQKEAGKENLPPVKKRKQSRKSPKKLKAGKENSPLVRMKKKTRKSPKKKKKG